jgi:hypothetical protein
MGLLVSTDRFDSAGLQGEDGDQMEFRRHFGGWTIFRMRWSGERGMYQRALLEVPYRNFIASLGNYL